MLTDTAPEVQEKLGLSDDKYDKFKDCARQAHKEYCENHPESEWANPTILSVSLQSEYSVMEVMNGLCERENVFPPDIDDGLKEAGMRHRLLQIRIMWRKTERAKGQSSSSAGGTVGGDGDDGGVGSAA